MSHTCVFRRLCVFPAFLQHKVIKPPPPSRRVTLQMQKQTPSVERAYVPQLLEALK